MSKDHYSHSSMVRHWRAKEQVNAFGIDWVEGELHSLKSPHDGYLVQVSFSTFPDHPEYIRVRSTNWRCEYEPNGIYDVEDARKFYRQLQKAGFVKVFPQHNAHIIDYYSHEYDKKGKVA